MSETERRYKYAHNRVLIEAQRILNPQFDDAVVFLSGAQVELLRNASQYLNRLTTYVAEYNPGYYLTPTVEDFDSILEIVADLEEALMGNPNTLWGYNDSYAEALENLETDPGGVGLVGQQVPEGEIWRVKGASAVAASASCSDLRIQAYSQGAHIMIGNKRYPSNGHWYPFICDVVLKEDEYFYTNFYGLTQDDAIYCCFWGYKMKVS